LKNIVTVVRNELSTIFSSFAGAILVFLSLAIWRTFDNTTFIFVQICTSCFLVYIGLMIFRISGKKNIFVNRELAVVAISFIIITSFALNIDRSRSVFVLKWVNELSISSSVQIEEIAEFKNLSPLDSAAVAQRLDEQKQLGMLREVGDGYELSLLGKIFIKLASVIAKVMNLDGFVKA